MPKPDPLLTALGRNLRKRREANSLTQEKLASLDPTYISGIERGQRKPGIGNAARIAVGSAKRGNAKLPQVVEG